jgi:hypothetical protein
MEQPGTAEPMIVSCSLPLSLSNRSQHRVQRGPRILEIHSHRDNMNWLQCLQMGAKIHGILFGGDEGLRAGLLAQAQQNADVSVRVTMMIVEIARVGKGKSGCL